MIQVLKSSVYYFLQRVDVFFTFTCYVTMGRILERMLLHWKHRMSLASILSLTTGTHDIQQHPKPQSPQQYFKGIALFVMTIRTNLFKLSRVDIAEICV